MKGQYSKRKIKKAIDKAIQWFKERPYYFRRYFDRKKFKGKNFTVISNNCWAGRLYQYLDMPYLSPTAGLYFFADDYLKFIDNLRYYLSLELEFISVEESKYCDILKERNHIVPIGRLDDVEIVFLHYKTKEEAKEKWERRKKRVNYDSILFKFSRMNGCTDEHLDRFAELDFNNKIFINNRRNKKYDFEYYIEGYDDKEEILNDTQPFPGKNKVKSVLKRLDKYHGG